MVITIDQWQEDLLNKSSIAPVVLADITSSVGTLRFCTNKSVTFNGNTYQPYLATMGNVRSSATFPDNHTANRPLLLHINNSQIEFNGTQYDHVSEMFYPVFPWERSEVSVRVLLTSGTTEDVYNGNAIPWVTSGTAGAPTSVNRDSFVLPVNLPDLGINDQLPLRVITKGEFPEADRDELVSGGTVIPIIVGSGVQIRARATTAGATTTVRTAVAAGTVLEVTDTTGWTNADDVVIGGMLNNGINISSVDHENLRFNLSTDLNTLPKAVDVGMTCIEDRATYTYTLANHKCAGDAFNVSTVKRGTTERVLIDPSKYSTSFVEDASSIGGIRTDLVISELTPMGDPDSGGITQPTVTVDSANHDHSVSVSQSTTRSEFAGGVSGGINWGNANDGNNNTAGTINDSTQTGTFTTHPAQSGVFVSRRYYMIAQIPTNASADVRMRRSTTSFLTITTTTGKGEFRSAKDTGGTANADWNVFSGSTNPTQCDCFEGWVDIEMSPTVSESTVDLTNTTRTVDVDHDVSGADLEVGTRIEATINGAPIPDDTGRYGPTTASGEPIERPDAVMRWILEQALGKTTLIDSTSYNQAAIDFQGASMTLRFAIDQPTKVNALLDQIADNSASTHGWFRDGHNVHYLPSGTTSVASFDDDASGVISIDWSNSASSSDLVNRLTAFYDRDWVQGTSKDEAYSSSVLGLDPASIAIYGNLSNTITGRSTQDLHLDMLSDASNAQTVVDEVIGHVSFPRKVFKVETSWHSALLEPGDIITVNTETLATGIEARIIEHQVDSRFNCRINAVETATPVSTQYVSSNASFTNTTDQDFNIANAWTMEFTWLTRADFSKVIPTIGIWDFVQISPFTNTNRITLLWKPTQFPDPQLWVDIYADNGSSEKVWAWNDLLSPINVDLDRWYNMFVTWDGTNIKLWFGPVGSTGSEITVSDKLLDNSVTQQNVNRRPTIFAGAPGATVREHQFKIWNVALDQSNIAWVGDNPHADFSVDAGNYTSSANLYHWYRFGHVSSDPGKDFAVTAVDRINVNVPAVIGTDRLFVDAPGITGQAL